MTEENKLELKRIRAFEYFNLFDKLELENWLNKNGQDLQTELYQFGNLNVYSNRKNLFVNLFNELNIEQTESYEKEIIESAIFRYAHQFMTNKTTVEQLGKNIPNFSAYIEDIENVNNNLYHLFYELKELSELRFDNIANWQTEVTRICKSILENKNDDT